MIDELCLVDMRGGAIVIEKYALPEMSKIFSEDNRYQLMTDVAVTACEAMADIGQIPVEAYQEIKAKAGYDIQRI